MHVQGPEGARNPRFDPLDTLDDEEDDDSSDDEDLYGGGYEGGVLPVAKQPGQRLWPRPGKMTPDVGRFLGKVSSKIVSKVRYSRVCVCVCVEREREGPGSNMANRSACVWWWVVVITCVCVCVCVPCRSHPR